ncbi:hypothetical protein Mgra_00001212 [Meloidogyne graminicola]|uniref:Uncharacterized protein n=1 Tax=Meloidogyne graminicola TaxID=189291 RepID=A0A8T0A123_9BILA|nr:hypothetical protein Mgra_00001212 [Meloidogyne graminicola]
MILVATATTFILIVIIQSTTIFVSSTSSPSSLRLISHKTNPGVAVASQELMDEWAPYRIVFLLILVASSVAIWASYKLLCESSDDREDQQQQQRIIAYQPLKQNSQLVLTLEGQDEEDNYITNKGKNGYIKCNNDQKKNYSFSSSFDDDDVEDNDDLTCLLVGGEGTTITSGVVLK